MTIVRVSKGEMFEKMSYSAPTPVSSGVTGVGQWPPPWARPTPPQLEIAPTLVAELAVSLVTPPKPLPHWWRTLLPRRPQADRQRWGDRANALADEGIPFPDHEELAYVELWGRPERMPPMPAPSAGLDERGWSADGRTWTAPEALGINFDEPVESSPRERPEPADDEGPRAYVGRNRRSSADEPIDPVAAAIKSVEQWREAGLGFLETSKKWPDPQDRAIYRSLAAGLLKHGLDEARAAGLDDALVADLARELAEASETVA